MGIFQGADRKPKGHVLKSCSLFVKNRHDMKK